MVGLLPLGSARADVDLWPLLEISDESTTVLYPFYVREGKFLMIFPLYYRTNEGRDHHVVWPIFKWSEGRLERLAPVVFRGDDTFTLFPIIRRTPDYTAWLVPPVFVARDGPAHGVFPLYLRTEHDFYALPLWHSRWSDDGSSSHSMWPLLSRETDAENDKLRVLWRLFGWEHHPDDHALFMAYLFHREWGTKRWWNLFFPVFSNYAKGEERGFYLFPYYQQRGPGLHQTGILPLFEYSRRDDASRLWLAPYYRSDSPHHSTRALFPLYMGRTKRDPATDEVEVSTSLLWPLYRRVVHRDSEGNLLERYRRFLIFSDKLERDGSRLFSILGIAIVERIP